MSLIVRTVCNSFAWFLVVFGAYIIVHGHLTPGGGFQGGAVAATATALVLVGYGGTHIFEWYRTSIMTGMESLGLLAFTLFGCLGLSHSFFYNSLAKSGSFLFGGDTSLGANAGNLNTTGTIALMNMAVGIEVVAGLSMILLMMFRGLHPHEEGKEVGHDR
jgi:multicomponent Na+:H+ antiporter subunit B